MGMSSVYILTNYHVFSCDGSADITTKLEATENNSTDAILSLDIVQ
jgi:hypothetical protein